MRIYQAISIIDKWKDEIAEKYTLDTIMHDSDILDSDSDMHAPPHAYGMLQPWLNRLSIYRQRGITGKIPDANFPVQPHSFEHRNPEGIQRYYMSVFSRLFLVLVMLRGVVIR